MDTVTSAMAWLGDSRLLLPVMATMGALWWRRDTRIAKEWGILLATMAGLIVCSKMLHKAAGIHLPSIGFYTVSGHAAMAALLYPLLGHCMGGQGAGTRRRGVLYAAGMALAIAIALSRVLTRHHTLAEIVAGLLLGCGFSVWFMARWGSALIMAPRGMHWVAGAAMLAGLVLWQVPTVSAERVLSHIAWRIHS